MTAVDLVNQVFDKYYHNEYLPSKIGGSPETNIVRFLMAINSTIVNEQIMANNSKFWIGTIVTWFTRDLPILLQLPKFPDETDEQFIERMIDFAEAQDLGGQSSATVKGIVHSILKTAINVIDDITILGSSTSNQWKDQSEGEDIKWSFGALWADTSETLRATIVIQIQFANSGVDTDPDNYEYWALSQNYTKIQDVAKLFIAPGITFELELLSP